MFFQDVDIHSGKTKIYLVFARDELLAAALDYILKLISPSNSIFLSNQWLVFSLK